MSKDKEKRPALEGLPRYGDTVRDRVTQEEGVCTGYSEYMWGCEQWLVHYKDKEGKDQTAWWDVTRVEVVERGTVELIPVDIADLPGSLRAATVGHRPVDIGYGQPTPEPVPARGADVPPPMPD